MPVTVEAVHADAAALARSTSAHDRRISTRHGLGRGDRSSHPLASSHDVVAVVSLSIYRKV
jgi:hypothetical protein